MHRIYKIRQGETRTLFRQSIPCANGRRDGRRLYELWFDAYASTRVRVYADSFEDALEIAADWIYDTGKHDLFHKITLADYEEAALELGVLDEWRQDVAVNADTERTYAVFERTWEDITMIGHTTYPGLGEVGFLSWEWGGHEVT